VIFYPCAFRLYEKGTGSPSVRGRAVLKYEEPALSENSERPRLLLRFRDLLRRRGLEADGRRSAWRQYSPAFRALLASKHQQVKSGNPRLFNDRSDERHGRDWGGLNASETDMRERLRLPAFTGPTKFE